MARRTLAEPKTALAGAILTASFARFRASMSAFNVEMAPRCSLGCWVFTFMVKTGGRWERIVRRGGSEGCYES